MLNTKIRTTIAILGTAFTLGSALSVTAAIGPIVSNASAEPNTGPILDSVCNDLQDRYNAHLHEAMVNEDLGLVWTASQEREQATAIWDAADEYGCTWPGEEKKAPKRLIRLTGTPTTTPGTGTISTPPTTGTTSIPPTTGMTASAPVGATR